MSAPSVFPLQPVRTAERFSSVLHTRFQGRAKRGRGKAVSWPPEDQICQIRFFLSNDAPSTLVASQSIFQSDRSKTQSGYLNGSLDIPPGSHSCIAKRAKVNSVADVWMSIGVNWFSSQKFVQECDWLVADGNESEEVGLQRQRELRVLEAFYPRLTSIPDSPAEPVEVGKCINDSLVSVVPLVPIEDEDENCEGLDATMKEHGSGMPMPEHENRNDEQKPQLAASGSLMHLQDSRQRTEEQTISEADPKVAAAAAAGAACMAMQKFGASGLVDQELLVEILRNPAFLKTLTCLSAPLKDLAGAMNENGVGIVGHLNRNPHNVNHYVGPLVNKAPFNTGLPSPVSVLSHLSEEHPSKFLSSSPSNLNDTSDASNVIAVSSCMPASLLSRHSHSVCSSRENVMCVASVSAPLQGAHLFSQESGLGLKASHLCRSAHTPSIVHTDRSCGIAAPLAPFPCQNAGNFNVSVQNCMQPAQVLNGVAPQIGLIHHRRPCRSSQSNCRLRGMKNENSGLGFMSKVGSNTARLCIYFNSPRGCRNGGNCAFLHQSPSQELNSIAK